jgi:ureidoglycolate hydrolase
VSQATLIRRTISLESITETKFHLYGQLIKPTEHGKIFDHTDAQLNLSQGQPRFYLMHLDKRGRSFHQITRHQQCTQCLGSLGGKDWFLVVAPPNRRTKPDLLMMRAFRIPGDCFVKLEMGTWHAGPYFDHEFVDFYNLELSQTNIVDHDTYDFRQEDDIEWVIF